MIRKGIKLTSLILLICVFSAYAAKPVKPAPNAFSLSSTAFANTGMLPARYTCDGKNIPPQLSWKNIPEKTVTLALIFSDPDASGGIFYHWVLYNIPNAINSLSLDINTLPAGIVIGKNSWNKTEYNGACPPKDSTHKYVFTLYAVDTKLDLPNNVDAEALLKAMQGHVIGTTTLTTIYGR